MGASKLSFIEMIKEIETHKLHGIRSYFMTVYTLPEENTEEEIYVTTSDVDTLIFYKIDNGEFIEYEHELCIDDYSNRKYTLIAYEELSSKEV